jgi:flavin-dependent dehydrogenase
MSRIGVIGGGPAGLLVASLTRDHEVVVFEEHPRVGLPRHCTSLVGRYTASFFSELLTSRIAGRGYKRFIFHTSLGDYTIEFREEIAFYMRRPLLEEKLAEKAESLGHVVQTGIRARPGGLMTIRAGEATYVFDKLVVADGARSEFYTFFHGVRRGLLYGVQAFVGHDSGDDAIHVDLSPRKAFFSWFLPLDSDVGIAGYITGRHLADPRIMLQRVSKRMKLPFKKVLRFFGGVVVKPGSISRPHIGGRVFFIGDALGLIKPFTYGGLYYIVRLAPKLVEAIGGRPEIYVREVEKLASFNRAESILASTKTHRLLSPVFLKLVNSSGLFNYMDYDEHYKLAVKSIISPLLLYPSLVKSITEKLGK